nr:MAG TPA: hypothetical protein [Bacteriophage sp.]
MSQLIQSLTELVVVMIFAEVITFLIGLVKR